jgi:hypothetical protein
VGRCAPRVRSASTNVCVASKTRYSNRVIQCLLSRYNRKLGAPLGPAKLDASTGVLSRHFESGTFVTLGPANKTNSGTDRLGFITADINNVAGEVAEPSVRFAGKFASSLECESICGKDETCKSYTWCGPTKGSYAEKCYLRNDTVWQMDIGHKGTTSGKQTT